MEALIKDIENLSKASSFSKDEVKLGDSVLDGLYRFIKGHPPANEQDAAELVVGHCLGLLRRLYQAFGQAEATELSEYARSMSLRKAGNYLLEIIALEGISRNLASNIGRPMNPDTRTSLRPVNALQLPVNHVPSEQSQALLSQVLRELLPLSTTSGSGLGDAIRAKMLPDLLAAVVQCNYAPWATAAARECVSLQKYLDQVPITSLYPALMALLSAALPQPPAPKWYTGPLATAQALLPLRRDGVQNLVLYLNSMDCLRWDSDAARSSSTISMTALRQSTQILSGVPSSLSASEYMTRLAPQLEALLEEREPHPRSEALADAAVYIISHGILQKRALGAPGTEGWRRFVDPILLSIRPSLTREARNRPTASTLVSSDRLLWALQRLEILTLAYPNPGLLKRIVQRITLPIWAIAASGHDNAAVTKCANRILVEYLRLVAGADGFDLILKELFWTGEPTWIFQWKNPEELEIVQRDNASGEHQTSPIPSDLMQRRVAAFQRILQQATTMEERGPILFNILKLLTQRIDTAASTGASLPTDQFLRQAWARLSSELLQSESVAIAANSPAALQLAQDLLAQAIQQRHSQGHREDANAFSSTAASPKPTQLPTDPDASQYLRVFGMLIASLASDRSFIPSESDRKALHQLWDLLKEQHSQDDNSPESPIADLLSDLLNRKATENSLRNPPVAQNPAEPDLEMRKRIMEKLTSDQAPVRLEGFSDLGNLFANGLHAVETEWALCQLLLLLQDPDDAVKISATTALTAIARKGPDLVFGQLLTFYCNNADQTSLEARIGIGNALCKVLQDSSVSLPWVAAQQFRQVLLHIAAPRMPSPQEAASQLREARKVHSMKKHFEDLRNEELPAFWRFSEEATGEQQAENEQLWDIMQQWKRQPDDGNPQLRANALSIYGLTAQYHARSLGRKGLTDGVEAVLLILNNDLSDDQSIIRRAAARVLVLLPDAFTRLGQNTAKMAVALQSDELLTPARLLEEVQKISDSETDLETRAHLDAALVRLKAWQNELWEPVPQASVVEGDMAKDTEG